ncbi:hypothetical protein [Streptomyces sp. NPDC059168]|uniref:hypothetical protein n=1 Tax=Streptomyces sp. NPDC059168 TaxID=3346753 RepID=UPI0036896D45
MPLVFVHGIANRRERGAYRADRLRDAMFTEHLLPSLPGPSGEHRVHAAYWGDLGGKLRWNGDSIPQDPCEPLGSDDNELNRILEQLEIMSVTGREWEMRLVLDAALHWLPDAIDLLFTLITPPADDEAARALAALGARVARYYGPDFSERAQEQASGWLSKLRNDEELIDALAERVPIADDAVSVPGQRTNQGSTPGAGGEALGEERRSLTAPWSALRNGARRLGRAAKERTKERALRRPVRLLRDRAASAIPLFIGDITEYLAHRGSRSVPGPIVQRVVGTLEQACAERTPELPLYVVAHSMGGNIVYDILTHFRPDLSVDFLVTVGSQTGLFEELKLFRGSDPSLGADGSKVHSLPNVSRWLNVVDLNDPLAFNAEPIFDGVVDYNYASKALWAHSAWLHQPTFHARLASRLTAAHTDSVGRAE